MAAPTEIGAIIRQTADLRRLCLSLREAAEHDREAALAAEYDRMVVSPESEGSVRPGVLRAGFRRLWIDAQYETIVEWAHRLGKEPIEADEMALLYYTCALRRLEAGTKSADEESP